jgi:hypothetical protein
MEVLSMYKVITLSNPAGTLRRCAESPTVDKLSDLYRRLQYVQWRDKHGRVWEANTGLPNTLSPEHRENLYQWLRDRAEALYQLHLVVNTVARLSRYDIREGGMPAQIGAPLTAVGWLESTPLVRALLMPRDEDEPWAIY